MSIVFTRLYLFLAISANGTAHNFSIVDYWQKKCNEGEQRACEKAENSKQAERKLQKLHKLADAFRDNIDTKEYLLDDKPNLGKAYPVVLEDYLAAFPAVGAGNTDRYAIEYCAGHFHNYWLNKKFWWPTNAEDKPDWSTIYVYIVDHYHGICLNRPF